MPQRSQAAIRASRWDGAGTVRPMATRTDDDPTAEVTDLLQQLIRNACVNDGTAASGGEARSVDVLAQYLGTRGLDVERYEPAAGAGQPRRAHRGHRPDRAERCCSWATPTWCR